MWDDFCANQIKLEEIRLRLCRFEWDLIAQVVSKSFQTLVSIDVTVDSQTVMEQNKFLDISILRKCEVLKMLSISSYTRKTNDGYFL